MKRETTTKIKHVASFAAVCAVVATLCDLNHVFTGTLSYPNPTWFGQPWWGFPAFFGAFCTMALAYLWVVPQLPDRWAAKSKQASEGPREFGEAMATFALAYLASGLGNYEPVLLTIALYGTFFVRCGFTYERRFALSLALVLAISGMAVEGAMAAVGVVEYRAPDVFHVPLWLGAVYAHGALALREGTRAWLISKTREIKLEMKLQF